jgi:hypothetical protein
LDVLDGVFLNQRIGIMKQYEWKRKFGVVSVCFGGSSNSSI